MHRDSQRLLSIARSTALAFVLAVGAALGAGSATAASQPAAASTPPPAVTGPEASIPFANHGGIYDYHADNDQGIWIQARSRQWYYGQFFAPCVGIQFSLSVGFRASPTGSLDRWSEVFSREGGRCALKSLRSSDPPPGYERRPAKNAKPK